MAYLSRFPFSGLLRVAPYCAPGGISVVSTPLYPRYRTIQAGFHAVHIGSVPYVVRSTGGALAYLIFAFQQRQVLMD